MAAAGFPFYYITDKESQNEPVTGDSYYVGVTSGQNLASKVKNVQMSHGLGSMVLGPIKDVASEGGLQTFDPLTSLTVVAVEEIEDWSRIQVGGKVTIPGIITSATVIRKFPDPLPFPHDPDPTPPTYRRIELAGLDTELTFFTDFSFSTVFFSTYRLDGTSYVSTSVLDANSFVVEGKISLVKSADPGSTPDVTADLTVSGVVNSLKAKTKKLASASGGDISVSCSGTFLYIGDRTGDLYCELFQSMSSVLYVTHTDIGTSVRELRLNTPTITARDVGPLSGDFLLGSDPPGSSSKFVFTSEAAVIHKYDFSSENTQLGGLTRIREHASSAGYGRIYTDLIYVDGVTSADAFLPARTFPSDLDSSVRGGPSSTELICSIARYNAIEVGADFTFTSVSGSPYRNTFPGVLTVTEKIADMGSEGMFRSNRQSGLSAGSTVPSLWQNTGSKIDDFALKIDQWGEGEWKRPFFTRYDSWELEGTPTPISLGWGLGSRWDLLQYTDSDSMIYHNEYMCKYETVSHASSPWIRLPDTSTGGIFLIIAEGNFSRNASNRSDYIRLRIRYYRDTGSYLATVADSTEKAEETLGDYGDDNTYFRQTFTIMATLNRNSTYANMNQVEGFGVVYDSTYDTPGVFPRINLAELRYSVMQIA